MRGLFINWGNLFVAGLVAAVFVGRLWFGLPYWGVWVGVAAAAFHFVVIPRILERRIKRLDRTMLFAAQRGDAEALAAAIRGAWFVRIYAQRGYVLGRRAWAASEAGRLEDAERLYEQAALASKQPDRSRYLANLVGVKRRLGKDREANRLKSQVAHRHPELRAALDQEDEGV